MKGDIIMPLFERGYRAAAKTELEREMRKIEEKDRKAQKAQAAKDLEAATAGLESNLTFAERLNLISAQQASAYRERIRKVTQERERVQGMEQGSKVEGANAGQSAGRRMSMEEAKAEIARARAKENEAQTQRQIEQTKDENDGARAHG